MLLEAIEPFLYSPEPGARHVEPDPNDPRQQFEELLAILVNPTLARIREECQRHAYTHVHVLAHGDLNDASRNSYGLALQADDETSSVVSGEQLACALTSVQDRGIQRPTVATLASCDSANVGTVVVPGASFGHALHQSVIPLVIASQFPLSKDGSMPLTKTLYDGLLWGDNPVVLLYEARAALHTGFAFWHDWASLVVYEALPQNWAEQLDTLRYKQSKRAMNAALQRIDLAVIEKKPYEFFGELNEALQNAVHRLPLDGQYGIECLGLRASSYKRLAQAVSQLPGDDSLKHASGEPAELLQKAMQDYEEGARSLLVNDVRGVQRVTTLRWLLVQVVSLAAVLGRDIDERKWIAAKLCADLYLEISDSEQQAWAHASLAELWLVRLAQPDLSPRDKQSFSESAREHTNRLSEFYPLDDEFPIKSTRRQLERYVYWWGRSDFEDWEEKDSCRNTFNKSPHTDT